MVEEKKTTRPLGLTDDTHETIRQHINSFKRGNNHYSLAETEKIYLPESLNIY